MSTVEEQLDQQYPRSGLGRRRRVTDDVAVKFEDEPGAAVDIEASTKICKAQRDPSSAPGVDE